MFTSAMIVLYALLYHQHTDTHGTRSMESANVYCTRVAYGMGKLGTVYVLQTHKHKHTHTHKPYMLRCIIIEMRRGGCDATTTMNAHFGFKRATASINASALSPPTAICLAAVVAAAAAAV